MTTLLNNNHNIPPPPSLPSLTTPAHARSNQTLPHLHKPSYSRDEDSCALQITTLTRLLTSALLPLLSHHHGHHQNVLLPAPPRHPHRHLRKLLRRLRPRAFRRARQAALGKPSRRPTLTTRALPRSEGSCREIFNPTNWPDMRARGCRYWKVHLQAVQL